jgi:hypothetical protein
VPNSVRLSFFLFGEKKRRELRQMTGLFGLGAQAQGRLRYIYKQKVEGAVGEGGRWFG